jgi:hypothetical protein
VITGDATTLAHWVLDAPRSRAVTSIRTGFISRGHSKLGGKPTGLHSLAVAGEIDDEYLEVTHESQRSDDAR